MAEIPGSPKPPIRSLGDAALDYEEKTSYTFTVEVSDGLVAVENEVTVTVIDKNDPPSFELYKKEQLGTIVPECTEEIDSCTCLLRLE